LFRSWIIDEIQLIDDALKHGSRLDQKRLALHHGVVGSETGWSLWLVGGIGNLTTMRFGQNRRRRRVERRRGHDVGGGHTRDHSRCSQNDPSPPANDPHHFKQIDRAAYFSRRRRRLGDRQAAALKIKSGL